MARILLVDDDAVFAYAVSRFLTSQGHDVVAFHEPIQALNELESQRAVDLMVTDILLPDGTPHGFSLGRMAKMRRPELRIIFMTGSPDIAEREKTPQGPVLQKPFELSALGTAVAVQLAEAYAVERTIIRR